MDSNQKQTYCVGGQHMSNTIIKLKKLFRLKNGECDFCGRNKSQTFTNEMINNKQSKPKETKGEEFQKSAKCKNIHSSPTSNIAWTDRNSKKDILKKLDLCGKDGCKCQKTICFTPKRFEMEGSGFENTKIKTFKRSTKARNWFLKPTINTLAPLIGMAKSKNPQVAPATTNNLKSISGGKILSLTDMHSGAGLILRVMWFWFN